MSTETRDCVVIGGGPAGSTFAAVIKKYRPHLEVTVLEQARFPRYHIGESTIPAWQQAHLRGFYSRGAGVPAVVPFGRGFPDVALAAAGPSLQRGEGEALTSQGYQAVVGGRWIDHAGGTSVAAPIWAAIIARANQARRAARLPRLGFANPLLYSLRNAQPAPFREVTAGAADVNMLALNSHGRAAAYHLNGFVCQAGWDPVTGLGVPDVGRLVIHLT